LNSLSYDTKIHPAVISINRATMGMRLSFSENLSFRSGLTGVPYTASSAFF
jgi:hypothetical protein